MEIKIIFEDKDLLVIDKPYGVVVNRAETNKGETIQDWIEKKWAISNVSWEITDEISKEFLSRGGIVHRLDKDTSGLLIIAKNPVSFENLKNQFKNREVSKKYYALVHGKVEPGDGTINAPIERNPFNRMHFGIFPGGREAETRYNTLKYLKVLKNLKKGGSEAETLSLLEVTPKTGRTHQIRVHMKYINHPVVSDPIYGGRKQIRDDLKICPRLFLHAKYLRIKHPGTGQFLEFNSDLPKELDEVVNKLEKR